MSLGNKREFALGGTSVFRPAHGRRKEEGRVGKTGARVRSVPVTEPRFGCPVKQEGGPLSVRRPRDRWKTGTASAIRPRHDARENDEANDLNFPFPSGGFRVRVG